MGLFTKLFGGGASQPAPAYDYVPSDDAPATIHLTLNGSPIQMPREDYRIQVLPGQFQQVWNDPDGLAAIVDLALRDEFIPDALEPARQLHRIDPQPVRAAIYLAATLIALDQNDEAETLLIDHIRRHGESGIILTNLAKVQANKGDEALSERTLWRALEKDPNQENGFFWYLAIVREKNGEAAQQETLRKLAALPESWRAQLWLARAALDEGGLDAALGWYRQALRNASPASADLLQQISGDLGNNGHLDRIIELCAPLYDVSQHGMAVGNNLIKAYIELGEFPKARAIIEQLRSQDRGDWNDDLIYWENELAQRAGAS